MWISDYFSGQVPQCGITISMFVKLWDEKKKGGFIEPVKFNDSHFFKI